MYVVRFPQVRPLLLGTQKKNLVVLKHSKQSSYNFTVIQSRIRTGWGVPDTEISLS